MSLPTLPGFTAESSLYEGEQNDAREVEQENQAAPFLNASQAGSYGF